MNHLLNLKLIVWAMAMTLWPLLGVTQNLNETKCVTIDFETVPGDSAFEGLFVGTQYLSTLGMVFTLENGTIPRLAKIGAPSTAFLSLLGDDIPNPGQGIGEFFLTDDGTISGSTVPPLVVSFASELDSASGVILDIDAEESFTIQARDVNDSILEEIIIIDGDPGTGDGLATSWGFKRAQPDILSIRFVGLRPTGNFGLGFDNFTTCTLNRTTTIGSFPIEGIVISPNPAPGAFTLLSPNEKIKYLTFYDLSGRQLPAKISYNQHEAHLQSNYHGLAFVKVQTNKRVRVQKVWME